MDCGEHGWCNSGRCLVWHAATSGLMSCDDTCHALGMTCADSSFLASGEEALRATMSALHCCTTLRATSDDYSIPQPLPYYGGTGGADPGSCDPNQVCVDGKRHSRSANPECSAAVQIRSTLTFPVIWAPVANLAPTIFLRLRQYVH
eukprot:SAG11_NODE_10929_length_795_cov_4.899425_2_plen_146_part_01